MSDTSGLKKKVAEVRRHSRLLVRELDVVKGVYLNSGYTFTQCHVLFELSTDKSLGLMEIAERLLLDKSNTSRTVKKLVELGLVKSRKAAGDGRQKFFSLSAKGEKVLRATVNLADDQVANALDNLSDTQRETVIEGLRLYGNALRKSRLQSDFEIRPIQKKDDPEMASVIREVMTEFGAVGEGYSINDPEVDSMTANYRHKEACYYVITKGDSVVGGGGIACLEGGTDTVAELRKMFFLPEARGVGLGRKLLRLLLDQARKRGYKKCYLETLDRMGQANKLYLKNGFQPLEQTMGNTGHCSCDKFYLLEL
jgi:putative acetyltransferase